MGLFPVEGLLPIVYTEGSEIQKTKSSGCVNITVPCREKGTLREAPLRSMLQPYISVCNCMPEHSRGNTGLLLLDEINCTWCIFLQ
jgi:hypothetical protein